MTQQGPEQKVGLSLSFCVGDVIAGEVREEEIVGIVASTKVNTPEEIDKLIENYRRIYWTDDPDTGEEVARRLFEEDRVYQPRLEDKPVPKPVPLRWIGVRDDWRESYPMAA